MVIKLGGDDWREHSRSLLLFVQLEVLGFVCMAEYVNRSGYFDQYQTRLYVLTCSYRKFGTCVKLAIFGLSSLSVVSGLVCAEWMMVLDMVWVLFLTVQWQ